MIRQYLGYIIYYLAFIALDCQYPRLWLDGTEDNGGEWILIEKPDNASVSQSDLIGDNPCVLIDDCGVYRFQYRVHCPKCEGLYDLSPVVEWNVPCCPEINIIGKCKPLSK